MEALMMYLLKMILCSAMLFGYYRVVLYNKNFHQWNRFYLLSSMLLSIIVPFISIPLFANEESGNLQVIIASMPWNLGLAPTARPAIITWQIAIFITIAIVSVCLLLRIIIGVIKLFIAYKTHPVITSQENVKLIITDFSHAPFSFFRWLFWRQDIDAASESGERMLVHELTHIREHHSYDKVFTEVVCSLFWMNPFFWLIRQELNVIHEFLADRKAIEQQDGAAFAEMILKAMRLQPITADGIVNPFFTSQIKRRLLMITTSKEPKFSYLRRVSGLGLMIFAALTLALSIQKAGAQRNEKPAGTKKTEANGKVTITKDKTVFSDSDVTVIADTVLLNNKSGGVAVTSKGEKVKIGIASDKTAHIFVNDSKASGSASDVIISTDRITVNSGSTPAMYIWDGKELSEEEMNKKSSELIGSINVLKGESAIEKYGGKGKNGVIVITSKASVATENVSAAQLKKITIVRSEGTKEGTEVSTGKPNPIIYLDGKLISNKEMQNINPQDIQKMDVWKGQKALDKYGDKGKDEVIEITMKKPVK